MPEVVTGSPGNQGTNSSGVGAVIFDSTVDPLRVHLDNLKSIDDAANERQKTQQQKLALVQQMSTALNPKLDGIFPADRQFLADKGQELTNTFQKYLASGLDPSNPASGAAFTDFMNKQQELTGYVAASVGTNKKLAQYTQMVDADARGKQELDHDFAAKGIAGIMSTSLADRANISDWDSKVIQQKPPELDTMLQDFVKKTYAKQDKTSSDIKTTPGGYMYQTTKAENFTPEQARAVAESIPTRPMMQKALSAAWQNEPEDKKQTYINKYGAGGMNPSLAEDKAKTDFAYDKLMLEYHQQSAGYKYLGASVALKEAAKRDSKNAQLADKYKWLPEMIADIHNGNPDVMSNQVYQGSASQPSTVYGTTRLNTVQLAPFKKKMMVDDGQGHMKEQEVQFPNSILMTFNKDGKVYLATSESKAMANPKIPGSEFISFDNPGETMTYLGNRLADKQALSGGWLAVDRVPGARTSGSGFSAKVMAPLTPQQQAATPVKQSGKITTKELPTYTPQTAKGGAKTPALTAYKIGDKVYNIPTEKVAEFLKDNPKAVKQ